MGTPDHGHGEAGFAIIEVMVSAVILVIAALAVYASLDVASATSGANKARSVAAALADQDLERMRSYRAVSLSNYSASRTVTVGGAAYTVASRADWVRDATGGTESCTSNATQADYLKITATVTSGIAGSKFPPVHAESLVAPPVSAFGPDQGTLAVRVTDRADAPVAGLPVGISGPTTLSTATNSVGCAIFGYIPVGSYEILLNRAGWVDPAGIMAVEASGTVDEGTVNVKSLVYDAAAEVTVEFESRYRWYPADDENEDEAHYAYRPARAFAVTVANSGIPGSGTRSFSGGAEPQAAIAATDLFPFATGYGVHTGTCVGSDPTKAAPDYYAANPGFVSVSPAGVHTVTVRQPALNLRVKEAGISAAGARVVVTSTETGCADQYVMTTDSSGRVTKTPTADHPYDPSVPFGQYSVCVDKGGRRFTWSSVDNTSVEGTAKATADLVYDGQVGVC